MSFTLPRDERHRGVRASKGATIPILTPPRSLTRLNAIRIGLGQRVTPRLMTGRERCRFPGWFPFLAPRCFALFPVYFERIHLTAARWSIDTKHQSGCRRDEDTHLPTKSECGVSRSVGNVPEIISRRFCSASFFIFCFCRESKSVWLHRLFTLFGTPDPSQPIDVMAHRFICSAAVLRLPTTCPPCVCVCQYKSWIESYLCSCGVFFFPFEMVRMCIL